jgi:hypothetical protein
MYELQHARRDDAVRHLLTFYFLLLRLCLLRPALSSRYYQVDFGYLIP